MATKAKAKTVDDFKSAHDPDVIVPTKIKAALAAIETEGAENWEYENDFTRRAGISQGQISAYRGQFEKHIVVTPNAHGKSGKRVYFGNAKIAARIRGE